MIYKIVFGIIFLISTYNFAISGERTITTNITETPYVGIEQYKTTLPLKDHEVVLTFDDGPLPKYTNQILDILHDENIHAVFFVVGSMVKNSPMTLQKEVLEGHAIGNHSWHHQLGFERLLLNTFIDEVETTAIETTKHIGSTRPLFFRFPGLGRSIEKEKYLTNTGYIIWSIDVNSDDWKGGSTDTIIKNVMNGLNKTHKGVILMLDIHANTVAALPFLIKRLRSEGYTFVRVQ